MIAGNYRLEVAPPRVIPEGMVRCGVCRNFASLTPGGRLRKHRDLFGLDCWNRVPEGTGPPLDAPPPVVLPPLPNPPKGPREKNVPQVRLDRATGNRRRPDGRCFECEKPIPPGRRLCGKCMAGRRT